MAGLEALHTNTAAESGVIVIRTESHGASDIDVNQQDPVESIEYHGWMAVLGTKVQLPYMQ